MCHNTHCNKTLYYCFICIAAFTHASQCDVWLQTSHCDAYVNMVHQPSLCCNTIWRLKTCTTMWRLTVMYDCHSEPSQCDASQFQTFRSFYKCVNTCVTLWRYSSVTQHRHFSYEAAFPHASQCDVWLQTLWCMWKHGISTVTVFQHDVTLKNGNVACNCDVRLWCVSTIVTVNHHIVTHHNFKRSDRFYV